MCCPGVAVVVLQKEWPLFCQWGNPLANVSDVISNPLADLSQSVRGYFSRDPLANFILIVNPINKKRVNLVAMSLQNLKVKTKIQEETDTIKNCQRLVS
jgi:hypothetical protein